MSYPRLVTTRNERDLRGVTFDFWNTLVHESGDALVPARLDAVSASLEEAGVSLEREAIAAAHAVAFARYQESWIANRQFVFQDAAVLMAEELRLEERMTSALLDGFLAGGRAAALRICDGAQECLAALRARGLRTAIICDIGLTPSSILIEWLERFGLHESFDALVFSDVVGIYKPEPAMFSMALEAMGGLAPSAVAHVGDRRRTDVQGAARSGLLPVRYRGVFDDLDQALDDAPIVVDDLAELPVALGFAST